MTVETKIELIPPKPYGLISDYSSIKYENKVCMYPGCKEPPIGSHVLSKSCIKKYANNQIIQLQTLVYEPFENIRPKEKRKYYKPCDLDKISTFKGFCNKHDHSLFHELDNFNGVVTPKIALLAHYRIICYGLDILQLQLKQHEFLKNAALVGGASKKTNEIARKIKNGFFLRRLKMAETDYLERKEICEQLLNAIAPQINYIVFQGGIDNPIFFGRAGIFLHQFSRDSLPKKFMPHMPYITYSSISDGRTCSLIFTYLPQDAKEYSNDLEIFINHPDFKKRLEILIYSQSDCCILRKDLTDTHSSTIKGILDYYR
ncbi:hypothetical protein ACFORL_07990 [Legionella dresdenensis]|uniref:Uncharacterized protein n=1 Tax=Legionella dresdenensis TaxID=450200 RepID=A0ABV8CFZ0_9GAMM